MEIEITVPTVGESVTEATVIKWLKAVGDSVELNDPLVELETDKVALEVNSPGAGVLTSIEIDEGGSVEIGEVLGVISDDVPASATEGSAPAQSAPSQPDSSTTAFAESIDNIPQQETPQQGSAPESGFPPPSGAPQEERVRMSQLRKRMAEQLKLAQNTAAMLTTFNEVDMTASIEMRKRHQEAFEKKHGVRIGFMSIFTQACVVALREFPALNAEIAGDEIIYKNHYDIGVAIGSERGLVVPVVRDANNLSFAAIERRIHEFSERAKTGRLALEELQGGTFTITNGGVYGSMMSTPILYPPQSGILGIHKIMQRALVMPDGSIQARPMMYLALTYDHRIVDGREAVSFLIRIKECVEDPRRITLDS